jgi:2-phosphosulfolactate phosphatase
MLTLEIQLLPRPASFDVVIVVDILRMTTTSSVLLDQGLSELCVVAEEAEARKVARRKNALLLGERGGLPLPGFDGGNSPLEYLGKNLSGKKAVVCTSNGSKAVGMAKEARHSLLGSIVNAAVLAKEAVSRANSSITIVCAGTDGHISLDDALGAVVIYQEIQKLKPLRLIGDDTLLVTRAFAQLRDEDLAAELKKSHHGQLIMDLGFEKDIHFAAQRNVLSTVGVKQGNCFVGKR